MLAVTVTPGGSPALRELPSPTAPPGGVLVRVHAWAVRERRREAAPRRRSRRLRARPRDRGRRRRRSPARRAACRARPSRSLRHLRRCLAGHEPLCPAFVASALEPGGFCELTAASSEHVAHAVLPLPDHVSDLAGSFVEPLACVLRGIEGLAGEAPSWPGAGSIGLLAAQALRARGRRAGAGAGAGASAARSRARLRAPLPRASASTARCCRRPRRSPPRCRCSSRAANSCSSAAAPVQPLDVELVYRRELVVRGLRSSTPRHLRAALALIASGAVECESLVDCVLGLDEFADGLARYRRPRGAEGGVRAVIAARFWAPARRPDRACAPSPCPAPARSCCGSRRR